MIKHPDTEEHMTEHVTEGPDTAEHMPEKNNVSEHPDTA
jgi:hypothetical protein